MFSPRLTERGEGHLIDARGFLIKCGQCASQPDERIAFARRGQRQHERIGQRKLNYHTLVLVFRIAPHGFQSRHCRLADDFWKVRGQLLCHGFRVHDVHTHLQHYLSPRAYQFESEGTRRE